MNILSRFLCDFMERYSRIPYGFLNIDGLYYSKMEQTSTSSMVWKTYKLGLFNLQSETKMMPGCNF